MLKLICLAVTSLVAARVGTATPASVEPFSSQFAARSGLRPASFAPRADTDVRCPRGDLRFKDDEYGRIYIAIGKTVLADHVGDGRVVWTDRDGCGMITVTEIAPGRIRVETTRACRRNEPPARLLIQTFAGGFVFRSTSDGRALTCAMRRL